MASIGTALPLNKHQQKTEATRRKLLKAALRVFAQDGFEAARIEDIAAEAGYTRGAFYAQFQTKEDLFFSLLEDESRKHVEQLREMLERCETKAERFNVLRDYYATRKCDRQWSILILEFKLYALRHPKFRATLARMHRGIRERMKWEGLERVWPEHVCSEGHAGDLRRVALSAILHALVVEHAYDPTSISEDELSTLLQSLFDFLVE